MRESGPSEGYLPGSAGYRRVVSALFVAGLATFAVLYSTQAVLPDLGRDFGVSIAASTLTVSLSTISLAVALLVAGPLSDRFGRTRLIHVSMAGTAVVAVGCAVAPTWEALLALRLLAGVTLAGLPAVATAYLREELHVSTQGRATGLYVGGTALGGMAGRLVTGWVAELAGWRWGLAALAVLTVLCGIAVRALLPPSRRFSPAPTGVRSLATRTRGALTDPALLMLYGIGACSIGAFVAVFNTTSYRLEAAPFHLGLGMASLIFLVHPLGSVSSAVSGRLADSLGRRAVLPVGCLIALAGLLVSVPDSLPLVVLGLAVFVIGFFVVHGVASGWVPARAHAGGVATGQAASLYLVCYYVGSSVFGSVGGQLWASHGWTGVVTVAAALVVTSGLLGLALRRTRSLVPGGRR